MPEADNDGGRVHVHPEKAQPDLLLQFLLWAHFDANLEHRLFPVNGLRPSCVEQPSGVQKIAPLASAATTNYNKAVDFSERKKQTTKQISN